MTNSVSSFNLRTLDNLSMLPVIGMFAGGYRFIEGTLDFAIATIKTIGSLFDSQKGSTSTQAIKILESLKEMGRGFIEILPIGFIFSVYVNEYRYMSEAKKYVENNNAAGAIDLIIDAPSLQHNMSTGLDEVYEIADKFIEEKKPILAARLYIAYFNRYPETNLNESDIGYTSEDARNQMLDIIKLLDRMDLNEANASIDKRKLANQLLEYLEKDNPTVQARQMINKLPN